MKRGDPANWSTPKDFTDEEVSFDYTDLRINGVDKHAEVNVSSDDEIDEDLEAEYLRLNRILDLPADSYSFTKLKTNLKLNKYDTRSGTTHMFMHKFSPFSRGLQGAAIAISAIATTGLLKAHLWNESVIDQILEDGDTYYCASYKHLGVKDRRSLTVCDLKESFVVQHTHQARVLISDAVYTGLFNPETPTDLHIIKAIKLFFDDYPSGILTSARLNVSIWQDSSDDNNNYCVFDGQPRSEDLEPDPEGVAKLMILPNLASVLCLILEKSNLNKDYFVLYPIKIASILRIDNEFDLFSRDNENKNEKSMPREIKRYPSGYDIQGPRALVRASIHLTHANVPEIIRGHSHLIIALSAIIYSRLINANKWTASVIDLIFNQSQIYFVDLLRALGKKIDELFSLTVDQILTDVFLGVYKAKLKITENVVPGQAKKGKGKGKLTLETGIREFFGTCDCGVLEIKKIFYAFWKTGEKFYFFDPFGCDGQGFRVDATDAASDDPRIVERFNTAVACVTMHTAIGELVEIIRENTASTEKDPFILHGVKVLYVTAGAEGFQNEVIYREPKTNRRPEPNVELVPCNGGIRKEIVDDNPKPRAFAERTGDKANQWPELIENAEAFVMPRVGLDDSGGKGFRVVNSKRLILHGSKNCFAGDYQESLRGKQGLLMAIVAMAFSKVKDPSLWTGYDLDNVLDVGNRICFTFSGGEEESEEEDEEEKEEDEDEEEEDDDKEDEDDEDEDDEQVSYKDISKLPNKIKFDKKTVNLKKKRAIIEGNAEPIVNIGEAFGRYFKRYNELILENKGLVYGIWKESNLYYLFNPYGCDAEGWRLKDHPAGLVVMDSINELVDLIYGTLEFNDRKFSIHFVQIKSVLPDYIADDVDEPSEFEKYQTQFLPLTDDDLVALAGDEKAEDDKEKEEEEDDDDDDETDESEDEDEETEEDTIKEEEEIVELDPWAEISEQEPTISPDQLNFYLLTANVDLEEEELSPEAKEAIEYEKLKYNHPPPYVLPNDKVLEILLSAKKALQSVPSLVSCFSVDSKLAVKTNLEAFDLAAETVSVTSNENRSKMIRLMAHKYFYSRIPPIGYTPLRAINEKFIYDESEDLKDEKRDEKVEDEKSLLALYHQEISDDTRIVPIIIPLGPVIQTPTPMIKIKPCTEIERRRCNLSEKDEKNEILSKLVCKTEDVIFDLIFPKPNFDNPKVRTLESEESESQKFPTDDEEEEAVMPRGFTKTSDSISVIQGTQFLKNRDEGDDCQFKSCFFAAILCILAKVQLRLDYFNSNLIDDLVLSAEDLFQQARLSKYLVQNWTYTIQMFGVGFKIILTEEIYAEPDIYPVDELPRVLESYLQKNSTGILIFENASLAFWSTNNFYYLFDPYACDKDGYANEEGAACLLEFASIETFLEKIQRYTGVDTSMPFRIYTLSIKSLEWLTDKNRKQAKKTNEFVEIGCDKGEVTAGVEVDFIEEVKEILSQDASLIELPKWTNSKEVNLIDCNSDRQSCSNSFVPLKNLSVSMLEVRVIENDVTRPDNPPFKVINPESLSSSRFLSADEKEDLLRPLGNVDATKKSPSPSEQTTMRQKPFDRKFNHHSILLLPLDLCVMAWSCIHRPHLWGARTIRSIYQASRDLAFDSLLAAQDSSVSDMTDGLLSEFNIANYRFNAVFAPLHTGTLYKTQGWNLAMSLDKIFSAPIYSGAVIVCGKAHIGIMKKGDDFYAWWPNIGGKTLKIITSTVQEDFLKIIVHIIGEDEEIDFKIRVITISYAQKMDPDCLESTGLHESLVPSSLPQIHRKDTDNYDLKTLLHPVLPRNQPIFIFGTAGYQKFEQIKEPGIKRCYFAALISVLIKRDIIQNPVFSVIDRILQISEEIYREIKDPKYHKEHIIRNVRVMNRFFDFRDVASPLYELGPNSNSKTGNFNLLKKQLQRHLKTHNDGILHLSNCCYGFWYCQSTNTYYYLDPYQNNSTGKRSTNGVGCLAIFPCLDQMIKAILGNCIADTTGFFIHSIHVETIDVLRLGKFVEDPMWVYLDYQWSFSHSLVSGKFHSKTKPRKNKEQVTKSPQVDADVRMWNNYVVEIPELIYSLWGTIGAYDKRFGDHVGRNQSAICVTLLAMQFLCRPSNWDASILDASVIFGDCFFAESFMKRKGECEGQKWNFYLGKSLKIFPHSWTIEYDTPKCGILYGGQDRLTLAAALKLTFDESSFSDVVIKCANAMLAVSAKPDGFYAIDPGWTGPPLFPRQRGAIYVLRCRNFNALVYALVKIINSNQREEFIILPLRFYFQQHCADSGIENQFQLYNFNNYTPGVAKNCGKKFNIAGNEEIYTKYRNSVKRGLCSNLENPEVPSVVPRLNFEAMKNVKISTAWHKNVGKRKVDLSNSKVMRKKIKSSKDSACDDYPRTVDFSNKESAKAKKFFGRKVKKEDKLLEPIDCYPRRKFLTNKGREEFKMRVRDMRDDFYKNYTHRIPFQLSESVIGEGESEGGSVGEVMNRILNLL
ncbi:Protein of unknown function [Cotesia congregata]|uniref:Uncharacterized protein n=1 Tax=Cotesia congregata TaxID=51543 RepID=A0A8J2MS73_COTCN|nr:Protein of unknown function [Cotesia congregata]